MFVFSHIFYNVLQILTSDKRWTSFVKEMFYIIGKILHGYSNRFNNTLQVTILYHALTSYILKALSVIQYDLS